MSIAIGPDGIRNKEGEHEHIQSVGQIKLSNLEEVRRREETVKAESHFSAKNPGKDISKREDQELKLDFILERVPETAERNREEDIGEYLEKGEDWSNDGTHEELRARLSGARAELVSVGRSEHSDEKSNELTQRNQSGQNENTNQDPAFSELSELLVWISIEGLDQRANSVNIIESEEGGPENETIYHTENGVGVKALGLGLMVWIRWGQEGKQDGSEKGLREKKSESRDEDEEGNPVLEVRLLPRVEETKEASQEVEKSREGKGKVEVKETLLSHLWELIITNDSDSLSFLNLRERIINCKLIPIWMNQAKLNFSSHQEIRWASSLNLEREK